MTSKVFQLSGTCNNYPWGRTGKESLAAQLCARTPGTGFEIENDKDYSEMWFGDYPDFPARVLETGELLGDHLQKNRETLLGKKVIDHFDAQLPFLPKILSIAKALPLQIHPNKDLSEKLHKQDPDKFSDPNHKPEIAVALGPFEVFAGFKPLDRIAPLFELAPLRQFHSTPAGRWTDETLRAVTKALLKADDGTVEAAQAGLAGTPASALGEDDRYVLELLPRLRDQYGPRDAGSLVALLCMNFLSLGAGDALYIPADGIHAYLSGNIVECMARSNNVLNTGFCPRADRDSVDLFGDALTFKTHARGDVVLPSRPSDKSGASRDRTVVYKPGMSEFDMLRADFGAGESDVISASEGPAVLIVTQGSGRMSAEGKEFQLKEGWIYYVAPGTEVKWEAEGIMQVFMAYVE